MDTLHPEGHTLNLMVGKEVLTWVYLVSLFPQDAHKVSWASKPCQGNLPEPDSQEERVLRENTRGCPMEGLGALILRLVSVLSVALCIRVRTPFIVACRAHSPTRKPASPQLEKAASGGWQGRDASSRVLLSDALLLWKPEVTQKKPLLLPSLDTRLVKTAF